ncbi:MAG: 6-bladed beta-propeller [Phycisphaera sp.]|nr:6-bladed beta-propeller [Phycisphaera sp.]
MHSSRRKFMQASVATAAASVVGFPYVRARGAEPQVLGQGDFKYRVVPGWGVLDAKTPVNNCHGIVCDAEGHVILLTDHTANNVIVYDKAGKLVHKWGTTLPGAHGLSIVTEGGRQVLYMTCLKTHRVLKTTLDGEVLAEWGWPSDTGKYDKADQYRPSWTLHLPGGDFFVLDGYGRDYIMRYDASGKLVKTLGGKEGGIVHWGPHGGMTDLRDPADPTLLIAMSDQQYMLRLSLDGDKLAQFDMPGGNPRQIRLHDGRYYVAHLADNWPKDHDSHGFVSVLDAEMRVLSNVAGSAPAYDDNGKLRKMSHSTDTFIHPHDLVVDNEHSIYVAQFASGNTYPIKLERV